LSDYDGLHLEHTIDNLISCFLIDTSATNTTIAKFIQMKNIMLNAATLGNYWTCVKNSCIM